MLGFISTIPDYLVVLLVSCSYTALQPTKILLFLAFRSEFQNANDIQHSKGLH